MKYKGIDRRAYKRIKIKGATITYKEGRFFFSKKQYVEEFLPVVEISRGGVRFMGKKLFTISSKVSLKISIPDEPSPLILRGRVRWTSLNPAMSYKYQIGIQFDPFALKAWPIKPFVPVIRTFFTFLPIIHASSANFSTILSAVLPSHK